MEMMLEGGGYSVRGGVSNSSTSNCSPEEREFTSSRGIRRPLQSPKLHRNPPPLPHSSTRTQRKQGTCTTNNVRGRGRASQVCGDRPPCLPARARQKHRLQGTNLSVPGQANPRRRLLLLLVLSCLYHLSLSHGNSTTHPPLQPRFRWHSREPLLAPLCLGPSRSSVDASSFGGAAAARADLQQQQQPPAGQEEPMGPSPATTQRERVKKNPSTDSSPATPMPVPARGRRRRSPLARLSLREVGWIVPYRSVDGHGRLHVGVLCPPATLLSPSREPYGVPVTVVMGAGACGLSQPMRGLHSGPFVVTIIQMGHATS